MLDYSFYTIAIIGFLGALSPGPDFIVVSKNSITHSRKAGILTSLGISLGVGIHCTYCILGLALLLSKSLLLFSIIRYIGASYIIYLGIKGLFSKTVKEQHYNKKDKVLTDFGAFREGLLINILNPKCILFMLSIFTMIVKPHTPYWAQAIYGLELAGIAIIWFCALSYLLTHRHISKSISKVQTIVTKVMGAFLVGLGIDLITSTHH